MKPINPTVVDPSGTGAKELDTQPLVQSTYADVRAFLLSDDEAQESEEDILGAGEEMDEDPETASIAETHHQSPPHQEDKPQPSHAPSTEASDTDSSCDDILKKYDNTLPLTERQLIDKLVEAFMSSLDKNSTTIRDLYKGLNVVTELLKEINNAVKDDPGINKKAHALKQDEKLAAWAKSSTNMAWNLGSRLSVLERAQNHI
ncbi:hypothetical protein Tco_1536658 [Tanacetum coccineum]